jgi:D-alanyl-D-alanine dipeptidase
MFKKFFWYTLTFFLYASAELIELTKINKTFVLDVRYATTNNFTGKKVYQSARCFLQKEAANALNDVQQELAQQNLGLKIFDAYRPLSVQKIFWEIYPDENYVADPKKGSRHNRGCAVDLTLIDLKTKEELVMPSGFDDFSKKTTRDYDHMTPEARENCKLLENIMQKHGFRGLPSEWWHFDFVGSNPNQEAWREYPVSDIAIETLA